MNPIFELDAHEYNKKLAGALKNIKEFEKPAWVDFVKSGPSRKRPMQDEDFWYKRAASILRQIYKNKIVGVGKLRTKYGGKIIRGAAPEEFRKSGGKIIRIILQQSDKAGFTETVKAIKGVKGRRAGRQMTDKGKKFLEGLK